METTQNQLEKGEPRHCGKLKDKWFDQLDIPKLRDLRRQIIEPFLDETLSIEDVKKFVQGYLSSSPSGEFSEFWTTIYYLFGTDINED